MLSCANWQVSILYFFLIKLRNFYQQLCKRFKPLWISVNEHFVPLYYFPVPFRFTMGNKYI